MHLGLDDDCQNKDDETHILLKARGGKYYDWLV